MRLISPRSRLTWAPGRWEHLLPRKPSANRHANPVPLQITHSDFARDLGLINKVYVPTAHKSYQFLRAGTWMLMATFFVLILVRVSSSM